MDSSPANTPVKRQKVDGPRQYNAAAMHQIAAERKGATSAPQSHTPSPHVQGNSASGATSTGERSTGQSQEPGGPPVGPGNPPAGFVQCPVCSMTLKEALMNVHLDRFEPFGPCEVLQALFCLAC